MINSKHLVTHLKQLDFHKKVIFKNFFAIHFTKLFKPLKFA